MFSYLQRLIRRSIMIEKVVNTHLLYIMEHNKKDTLKIKSLRTMDEKLSFLFKKQTVLQGDMEDTNSETRLRMEAITQSYDIFSSVQYKYLKPLKELMDFYHSQGQIYKLEFEMRD